MKELNSKFLWRTLDSSQLQIPNEILAYHIFKYNCEREKKQNKMAKDDLVLISSYLTKERLKEMGVGKCSRTK